MMEKRNHHVQSFIKLITWKNFWCPASPCPGSTAAVTSAAQHRAPESRHTPPPPPRPPRTGSVSAASERTMKSLGGRARPRARKVRILQSVHEICFRVERAELKWCLQGTCASGKIPYIPSIAHQCQARAWGRGRTESKVTTAGAEEFVLTIS